MNTILIFMLIIICIYSGKVRKLENKINKIEHVEPVNTQKEPSATDMLIYWFFMIVSLVVILSTVL